MAMEFDPLIDDRAVLEKRRQRMADEPGDVRVGEFLPDQIDGRQRMNDIAQRTGFDNEDPHQGSVYAAAPLL
jgi:hypothetical protein